MLPTIHIDTTKGNTKLRQVANLNDTNLHGIEEFLSHSKVRKNKLLFYATAAVGICIHLNDPFSRFDGTTKIWHFDDVHFFKSFIEYFNDI